MYGWMGWTPVGRRELEAANEGEKRWKHSVVCAVFTFLCFANAPSEKVPALQVKQVEAPANDIN